MSSESKDKGDKQELKFEDAMKMLKDPKVLAAAAAMHGFQLQAPRGEPEKDEPINPPGDIELPEEATTKDILAAIQKLLKSNNEYLLKNLERTDKKFDKKLQSLKYEQQASEVNRFIKKHKVPESLLPDMNAFWKKGDSLEEAYEKAKKLNDVKDEPENKEVKPEKGSPPENKPVRKSPRISEEGGETEDLEKVGFKSANEAARTTLKDMIAKDPDIAKVLDGDSGLED